MATSDEERHQIVMRTLSSMNLLDEHNALRVIDSLATIDLVFSLETAASISIPTSAIRPESFESIEAMVGLLRRFAR